MGVLFEVFERRKKESVSMKLRFKGLFNSIIKGYRIINYYSIKRMYFVKDLQTGKMYYSKNREKLLRDCEEIYEKFVKDFRFYLKNEKELSKSTIEKLINKMFIIYWNVMLIYDPFNDNFEKIMIEELKRKGFANENRMEYEYVNCYKKFKEFCEYKQISSVNEFVNKYLGKQKRVVNYVYKNVESKMFEKLWNLAEIWLKDYGFYILERKYGYNLHYDTKFSAQYFEKTMSMEIIKGTKRIELYRDGELIFKLILRKRNGSNEVEIVCDVEKCKEEPLLKEEILYGIIKRFDEKFTF